MQSQERGKWALFVYNQVRVIFIRPTESCCHNAKTGKENENLLIFLQFKTQFFALQAWHKWRTRLLESYTPNSVQLCNRCTWTFQSPPAVEPSPASTVNLMFITLHFMSFCPWDEAELTLLLFIAVRLRFQRNHAESVSFPGFGSLSKRKAQHNHGTPGICAHRYTTHRTNQGRSV